MAKKEKNLRDLSVDELQAKNLELERKVYELRNQLSINRKLEKSHLLKATRRERARVLTILTQATKGNVAL